MGALKRAERRFRFGRFLFIIALLFITAYSAKFMYYYRNGTEVECRMLGKSMDFRPVGYYDNEKYGIKNDTISYENCFISGCRWKLKPDTVFKGYVVKKSPMKVYRPVTKDTIAYEAALPGAALIIGFLLLLSSAGKHSQYKLFRKGHPARATLEASMDVAGGAVNVLSFMTLDRRELTYQIKTKLRPHGGEEYNIVYYEKPNGKLYVWIVN